jgi:poly(3-hydroxybutyrate) depolymerase
MDRHPGGQFPYSAFFWPALVAASAAETASSIAVHFMGFSGDADGDHTPQELEGAPIKTEKVTGWLKSELQPPK